MKQHFDESTTVVEQDEMQEFKGVPSDKIK